MRKHSKPSVLVMTDALGNDTEMILEVAEKVLQIEKVNGFKNWKIKEGQKYEFKNGVIAIRNTGASQEFEGADAATAGAAG